jgi:hypothetical protein
MFFMLLLLIYFYIARQMLETGKKFAALYTREVRDSATIGSFAYLKELKRAI